MRILNLELRLIFIVLVTVSLGLFYAPPAGAINIPSDVYVEVENNTLMVKKPNAALAMPFVIKGLSWSPATRAPEYGPNPLNSLVSVPYGFFFDGAWRDPNPQGYEVLNYWLKNQLSANYLTDIPLMRQMNVNTVRIYHSLGSSVEDYAVIAQDILKVLDGFYNNGKNSVMVIMTVAMSKADLDSGKYLQVVNAYKDHPAILMWAIGNEWNLNKFYGYGNVDEAAAAVIQAAGSIKEIDPHHPVSSVLGDVFNSSDASMWILKDVISRCPNVDIWGINVYRGSSFNNLFLQWKNLWEQELQQLAKPFYVSEFGIDSFNSTSYTPDGARADNVFGYENQKSQADVDATLWKEIKIHLSSEINGELCLGGLIHEFNDELWKVGSYHTGLGGLVDYSTVPPDHSYDDYNNEGFVLMGASPDNVSNEEYYGLLTADRAPKLAYERMRAEWLDVTPPSKPVVTDSGIYTNSSTTLKANWSSFDPDSDIVQYQYRIIRDSIAGPVIRNWTSTGTTVSVTASGLILLQGKTYYFSVQSKNGAGLWSAIGYSNGIKVDTTAPNKPVVTDGGISTVSTTTLTASWSSSDVESGITQYQYCITRDSTLINVIRNWTSTGTTKSVTASGLTLIRGKKYYFGVQSKNGAGTWSAVGYSDGILVQ